MQMQTKSVDTSSRDCQLNAELADVLTAISVVSKRLARKLTMLSEQDDRVKEGGTRDEQN